MPVDYKQVNLKGLLTLFTFDNKAALERYVRSVVIHQRDFVAFILACQRGALPLSHRAHFSGRLPKHLVPSEEDRRALEENGVGLLKPRAAKTTRKVFQLFRERRTLAGHMFFTPGLHEWHFFSFDQNDLLESSGNHWVQGAHMHFVNWLWPHVDPREVWSRFVCDSEKPNSSLHLRHSSGSAP